MTIQPRDPATAAAAAAEYLETIPPYPDRYRGRGIVTCAGSIKYNTCAWVLIRMLRHVGCTLPVQVWYLDESERDPDWIRLAAEQQVECVDASAVRRGFTTGSNIATIAKARRLRRRTRTAPSTNTITTRSVDKPRIGLPPSARG